MNLRHWVGMFAVVGWACGGGTGAGSGAQTWSGTLTGDNAVTDFNCPNGSFSESATFTLTVPSSLSAAVHPPYSASAEIRSGSGHYGGDENIGTQCGSSGAYTMIASHIDTDVTVTIASVVNDTNGPTPEIAFRANSGALYPFHLHQNTTGSDVTVEDEICDLFPTTTSDTQITGTWKGSGGGSASGNHAKGTFTLTRQ